MFNFVSEIILRKIQKNKEGLRTDKLAYTHDVDSLKDELEFCNNTNILIETAKEVSYKTKTLLPAETMRIQLRKSLLMTKHLKP